MKEHTQDHMKMAGHLLALTLWIRNVMTDLVILQSDPGLMESYKQSSSSFEQQQNPWKQKSFIEVRKKFAELFPEIAGKYETRLEVLQHLVDFFTHARYSLNSPVIHGPSDRQDQPYMSIELTEEKYQTILDFLMTFEEEVFPEMERYAEMEGLR
ncbi:hypothetical protein GVN16_25700 [Emticicia sp. CRIBPO]|uniref:hypothetical protein n=1 Tax=Emticicia sp. CRIBPO TaxID=2683258 RepID=UPI001412DE67|nr:hypothetical protein [Emticicia sp. CRIBPO]NBA89199.1 hypothetical protein [Emticicia sp. CRIBPO]